MRQDVYEKDLAAVLEEMGYHSLPGWQQRLREIERRSRARARAGKPTHGVCNAWRVNRRVLLLLST